MKAVVQEERSGCGLASVAVLSGKSYGEIQSLAARHGIRASDSRLWGETSYVRTLLAGLNITAQAGEQPFTTWEALPDRALLAIRWRLQEGKPFWHWTVFWRSPKGPLVFDSKKSLRSNIRTDFWRMKPTWYIPVTVPSGTPQGVSGKPA